MRETFFDEGFVSAVALGHDGDGNPVGSEDDCDCSMCRGSRTVKVGGILRPCPACRPADDHGSCDPIDDLEFEDDDASWSDPLEDFPEDDSWPLEPIDPADRRWWAANSAA